MKKVLLLTILGLASVILVGGSTLTPTCVNGVSDNGNCAPGQVTFTGTGFPLSVHVYVKRYSNEATYDDWDYTTNAGVLTFTETLTPADRYTITITGSNMNNQTQSLTTGAPIFTHDD
jgi:hypothetical protein